jgi:hypothetical protein
MAELSAFALGLLIGALLVLAWATIGFVVAVIRFFLTPPPPSSSGPPLFDLHPATRIMGQHVLVGESGERRGFRGCLRHMLPHRLWVARPTLRPRLANS